ncbi:class F sortase [Streptomyces sp. YU58]|uniref:class F sortase n=1 Tax=Streptomyces sp. SX92 TaxID=3158972 RepID=UPI0027B9A0A8|nr:class F sortase [Streptomyces coralus]WLW56217.1 class F sortase [Streptomyces coralus]
MARRHRRRPWYRTRAYRLVRTVAVTVSLVAGGVWWAQGEEPGGAASAARPGSPAAPGEATAVGNGGDAGETPQRRTERAEGAEGAAPGRPAVPPRAPKASSTPSIRPTPTPPPRPLPRSRATRLAVPFLDVDAPVTGLRLDRERRLPAPPDDDPNLVGWFEGGPSPGEQGTAVAVGHLDTATGPAVFAGLAEVERGRLIEVTRADGRIAVYAVDAVKSYEKDRFPNREVYGARGRPELRLITCGGDYDRRTGYSGNVVVFAHLVQTREPPGAAVRR